MRAMYQGGKTGRWAKGCVAVFMLVFVQGVYGAVFTVNDIGDAGDATIGDGQALTAGGVTTLRAAVQESNAASNADTIQFDPVLFSAPQTITVGSKITCKYNLAIQGPGKDILTITANDACPILYCVSANSLSIQGLTLQHGFAGEYEVGGAVYVSGTVLISGCRFSDNTSNGFGGGALMADVSSSLTLTGCEFSGNTAPNLNPSRGYGGAIYLFRCSASITACEFSGNTAGGPGGAITVDDAINLLFEQCLFSNNHAENGGGVFSTRYFNSTNLTIRDSLFHGNSAETGGGMHVDGSQGTSTLVNTTFHGNTCTQSGGALYLASQLQAVNCTMTENAASAKKSLGGGVYAYTGARFTAANTIIAGNSCRTTAGNDVYAAAGATVVSGGHNLIGNADGCTGFTGAGDLTGTSENPLNPRLGPLVNNGGPLLSRMPRVDSPARDAGDTVKITNPPFSGPPFYDQRGAPFQRIYNGTVDIGAVEAQPGDTEPPVLSLIGEPHIQRECETPLHDLGISAVDALEGSLLEYVVVTGLPAPSVPGDYDVTYDVCDAYGNCAEPVSRTITIVDTTPPVILLAGDNPMRLECHGDYVEPGATALDSCDTAPLSVAADASGLDTAVPGEYAVVYTCSDSSGNSTPPVTRVVEVQDATPPVLSLLGEADMVVPCGEVFTEPGVVAEDDCAGDLSEAVVWSVEADIHIPGVYVYTYTVNDTAGNAAAPVTRTVTMQDILPPIVLLLGETDITLECGDVYIEPGAIATDDCDGDLSAMIIQSGEVDSHDPGPHTLSYHVTDTAGNESASVFRHVTILDSYPPVLTLLGGDHVVQECHAPFIDPRATAMDVCQGDLSAEVVRVGEVDVTTPGEYALAYYVEDNSGNRSEQMNRRVSVQDNTPPLLTLAGEYIITFDCPSEEPFEDPGAIASDVCDTALPPVTSDAALVNRSIPGQYVIHYEVTDASGNRALPINRVVRVAPDTAPPQITLGHGSVIIVECGDVYNEQDVTAFDNCAGNITARITRYGTLDTSRPGIYPLLYSVHDAYHNFALEQRTVYVPDHLPPRLTLNGPAVITVPCYGVYEELGASANDVCAEPLSPVQVDTGGLNLYAAGRYTITYTLTDSAGNAAAPVTRTVVVEGPCTPPNHSADYDGDHQISVSELLRVIQLFNSGGYGCQAGSDDGYAPGNGDHACLPHTGDYNPQDWRLELTETLRIVQFYNLGGYHVCAKGEDGYCPGRP